ncbi:MAG: T9SS C-terminal target domain-containing protein [Candidatus Zixiibacteriota bacterium]|nr:MAG: T9SS C-terminal target domain-containing protein [candidate division Zixibacteria bacterium]
MKWLWMLFLLPLLVQAQEFPFVQEYDTIPVTIGEWQPFSPWNYGLYHSAPGFGDLDGDGDPDMAVGEINGHTSYYRNDGTPMVPAYVFVTRDLDSLQGTWEWLTDPCFADLDGDGDLDLINGYTRFFRNIGTAQQYDFLDEGPLIAYSYDDKNNQLVDLDADGDLDLLCGGVEGRLLYARNEGTPQSHSFTVVTTYFSSIDVGDWSHPDLADLDGDGDYDLVVGTGWGTLHYYRNDGTPQQYSFTPVSNYWLGLDVGYDAAPECCDLDGDGDYDLLVGREPTGTDQHMGDVVYLENIGSAQEYNFQVITSNYLTADVGSSARQQLVDIDADGDRDLLVGAGDEIRFFRNTGTPQNPAFTLEEEYYQNIHLESIMPWFCDIDADGDYDLFAGEGVGGGPAPGLHLYVNRGTPQNPQYVLVSEDLVPGNYFGIINPTLADIDADGDYDLFLTDDDNYTGANNIWFYENTGTPASYSFAAAVTNWQNINIQGPIHRYLRFFDVDGDGDLDLFFNNNWTEGSENLRFYRNVGTPQNAVMQWLTNDYLPSEVPTPSAGFCDIDADGRTDLFVGDLYGGLLFFHGTDTVSVSPYTRPRPQRVMDLSLSPQFGNPTTAISFQLPVAQDVDLAVYNLLGARVATLVDGWREAGSHRVTFDGADLPSGVYLVRLQAGGASQVEKVVLLK